MRPCCGTTHQLTEQLHSLLDRTVGAKIKAAKHAPPSPDGLQPDAGDHSPACGGDLSADTGVRMFRKVAEGTPCILASQSGAVFTVARRVSDSASQFRHCLQLHHDRIAILIGLIMSHPYHQPGRPQDPTPHGPQLSREGQEMVVMMKRRYITLSVQHYSPS